VSIDKRGLDAFKLYSEKLQRFDYFVTGGAGVVLAFALKEFPPATGRVAGWILPLSWALLLLSLGSGMVALAKHVEMAKMNVATHNHADMAAEIRSAALSKEASVELFSGQLITSENAGALVALHTTAGNVAATRFDRLATIALWCERGRNVALLTGLGALSIWRYLNI
jgi:hypothetical protein